MIEGIPLARYSLIIKDKTYLKLLKWCAKEGKSMGRLLNDIVDKAVLNMDKAPRQDTMNPHCMTCVNYVLRNKWCVTTQAKHRPNDTCAAYVCG